MLFLLINKGNITCELLCTLKGGSHCKSVTFFDKTPQ